MTIFFKRKLSYLILRSGKFGDLVTSFFTQNDYNEILNFEIDKLKLLFEYKNLVASRRTVGQNPKFMSKNI